MTIYLDYAATTPVDERVAERMARHLTRDGIFGNPGSRVHGFGMAAARAVNIARDQVAQLVGALPEEIIWTSGATESNNLALLGAAGALQEGRARHLVTVATEHMAVLDICDHLVTLGWEVTRLVPGPGGLLDLSQVTAALRDDTALLSVMHVNNEIGVVQDVAALGRLARERGVLFHVDAVQSVGKLPIDLRQLDVDLMSFSAHKIYGPMGIGALYVRSDPAVEIAPLMFGGGQQQGIRPGTLATHQIVGMGEAFQIAGEQMGDEIPRIQALSDHLGEGLDAIDGVTANGDQQQRVAGILNIAFADVDAEVLIQSLNGIALSTGSACAALGPSHVLLALGRSETEAMSSLRISMGRYTTLEEMDRVIAMMNKSVTVLRAVKARRQSGALS